MGEFSLTHILLVAIIFLIFFGPSRLPQLGQSLGKAIRGFKQGLNEIDSETKNTNQESRPQVQQQNSGQLHNQTTTSQTQSEKEKQNQNS